MIVLARPGARRLQAGGPSRRTRLSDVGGPARLRAGSAQSVAAARVGSRRPRGVGYCWVPFGGLAS
jgi:hypothetical protein